MKPADETEGGDARRAGKQKAPVINRGLKERESISESNPVKPHCVSVRLVRPGEDPDLPVCGTTALRKALQPEYAGPPIR